MGAGPCISTRLEHRPIWAHRRWREVFRKALPPPESGPGRRAMPSQLAAGQAPIEENSVTSRTTSGAEVCALIGMFGIAVWAGTVAVIVRAAGRRSCCPAWCPCRAEENYLDPADDGNSTSPFSSSWRPKMPIQRGGGSGDEYRA